MNGGEGRSEFRHGNWVSLLLLSNTATWELMDGLSRGKGLIYDIVAYGTGKERRGYSLCRTRLFFCYLEGRMAEGGGALAKKEKGNQRERRGR